jgi:hypothetical protein
LQFVWIAELVLNLISDFSKTHPALNLGSISNMTSNWVHPGPFAPYLLDQVGGNMNLSKFVGFWATLSNLFPSPDSATEKY